MGGEKARHVQELQIIWFAEIKRATAGLIVRDQCFESEKCQLK